MRINQPIDPVFRKRVIIANPYSSTNWPLIIGIVMIIIVSGLATAVYFNADLIQSIKTKTLGNNLTVEKPTSTKSANLEISEPKPPIVPKPPPPSIDINLLLTKANTQLAKAQFVSPKGDNAYETYQALVKTAPQQAQPILDEIVAWYFKQAQQYISINRLTQPKGENAYDKYQQLRQIAPEHQSTQALLSQIVKLLHKKAKQQMRRQFYTTPKNNNAVRTYRHIVNISPNDAIAENALTEIAKKYYKWAISRKNRRQYKACMTYIEKGLQAKPDDAELNELKLVVNSLINKQ
jgi:tetratricopeptide (TPR) repeat protein